jgi:hypothetical protein
VQQKILASGFYLRAMAHQFPSPEGTMVAASRWRTPSTPHLQSVS